MARNKENRNFSKGSEGADIAPPLTEDKTSETNELHEAFAHLPHVNHVWVDSDGNWYTVARANCEKISRPSK